MKFGKRLRNEIAEDLSEWEGEFISYKDLKKQLKLTVNQTSTTEDTCFMELLDCNVLKVGVFFLEKEEDYIIRLKDLKDILANLDYDGDLIQVKRDLVEFHRELVLLLQYTVLNFQGLLKIVKKHNKKTGNLIKLQYPLFTTDMLYSFLRECETMLNQLFPP